MEPSACDAMSFGNGSHLHWHRSFSRATCLPITVIVRGEPSLMMTPSVPHAGHCVFQANRTLIPR